MSRAFLAMSIVALWCGICGSTIYPPGALFLPTPEEQAEAIAAAVANPNAGYLRAYSAGSGGGGDYGSGSDFGGGSGGDGSGDAGNSSGGDTDGLMTGTGSTSGGMSSASTLPSLASLTFHQSIVTDGRVYGSFDATLADDTPSTSYTLEIHTDSSVRPDGVNSFYLVDDNLAGTEMTVRARVIEYVGTPWQSSDLYQYGEWQQFTLSVGAPGTGGGGPDSSGVSSNTGEGSAGGGTAVGAAYGAAVGTAYDTPPQPIELDAATRQTLEEEIARLMKVIAKLNVEIAALDDLLSRLDPDYDHVAAQQLARQQLARQQLEDQRLGKSLIRRDLVIMLDCAQQRLGQLPTRNLVASYSPPATDGNHGNTYINAWNEPWVRKGQIGCVVVAGTAAAGAGALAYAGVDVVIWGTATGTAAAGGGAAAGGAALADLIGTQAVVAPGLGAGTYPGLVINGTVYVARFHHIAWELAGMVGTESFYGIVIIDAAGKVLGFEYQ